METPVGSVWKYPGWFTTFVSYPSICDYWYSGHVGFCFIHYLEFRKNGEIFLSTYSIILMVFTSIFLVVMRSHYAIDVPSGFIIGHFIWIYVDRYSYIFDYYVMGIPLHKRITTYN